MVMSKEISIWALLRFFVFACENVNVCAVFNSLSHGFENNDSLKIGKRITKSR